MTKTILVVEDNVALSEAITLKLKKEGYNVIPALNAEKAIEVLEKDKKDVDFIWLDILLPGMNGLDFLKYIRGNEGLKDKKVAIVSVSGGIESKEKGLALGIVDYIVKSELRLEDIIKRVKEKI